MAKIRVCVKQGDFASRCREDLSVDLSTWFYKYSGVKSIDVPKAIDLTTEK